MSTNFHRRKDLRGRHFMGSNTHMNSLAETTCVQNSAKKLDGNVITQYESLARDIGKLFNQQCSSDVIFSVDGVRFYAHKCILAARNEYFRAMLYGGMRESQEDSGGVIEMKECHPSAFEMFLYYVYTGSVNFASKEESTIFDLLRIANLFGAVEFEEIISNYLRSIIKLENVCFIYDAAFMLNLDSLKEQCTLFIDKHVPDILASDSFLNLTKDIFVSIINRDSFCCPEIEIFNAVTKWHERNNITDPIPEVVNCIRLPLMSVKELLNEVRESSLIRHEMILDAIKLKHEMSESSLNGEEAKIAYRGFLFPEMNLATTQCGANVIEGEMRSALLDDDCVNYDLDNGFCRHRIDNPLSSIVVKLGSPSIINHIRMLLWDRDIRSYSYYIEVSMDQQYWTRIVDHTKYLCRSWQTLSFPRTVAQYIKICGTHNTVNRIFHLVYFTVCYTLETYVLSSGLIVPEDNVAFIGSAAVISGVSRNRNALINGDYTNYDWDSGYTCHQLGSGSITIQLNQPYIIGSLRLLLWDCDNRSYSYYIETSVNWNDWEMVVDKKNESCRSWQINVFPPRPVVFIKIVGVHNTANEVFHCVHFECPCSKEALESWRKQNEAPKTDVLT